MLEKISLAVSYISEPFFTSTLAFGLVLLKVDANLNDKIAWGLMALIFGALPPIIIYIYEKRVGKIKDWMITNRIERRDVHLAWIFGSALLSIIYWQLDVPRLLIAFTLSLFALSVVIMLVLVLLLVYSSTYLFGVLIIGVVAWSRIYIGHHTLSQVTAASVLTIIVIYYVFSQFGLATF